MRGNRLFIADTTPNLHTTEADAQPGFLGKASKLSYSIPDVQPQFQLQNGCRNTPEHAFR